MAAEIEGDPAAEFTLVLSDGSEFTLGGETRPVYLVFWAEWCPTCKRELPVVDALAQEYGEQIAFIAVAGKADYPATEEEANRLFSPLVRWGLDDSIWDLYQVPYQPASFFITGNDVIIESYAGPVPEDEMRALLDELVALSG
jgi:thiol-disulfide isomerase/thioredoxin